MLESFRLVSEIFGSVRVIVEGVSKCLGDIH